MGVGICGVNSSICLSWWIGQWHVTQQQWAARDTTMAPGTAVNRWREMESLGPRKYRYTKGNWNSDHAKNDSLDESTTKKNFGSLQLKQLNIYYSKDRYYFFFQIRCCLYLNSFLHISLGRKNRPHKTYLLLWCSSDNVLTGLTNITIIESLKKANNTTAMMLGRILTENKSNYFISFLT